MMEPTTCPGCLYPHGALPPPHTFREGCILRSPIGERLDRVEQLEARLAKRRAQRRRKENP